MSYKFAVVFTLVYLTSLLGGAFSGTTSTPLDPTCPKGLNSGIQQNIFQWLVPASEVMGVVGSFFNITWYVSIISCLHSGLYDTDLPYKY
jgi:hypothetical protein